MKLIIYPAVEEGRLRRIQDAVRGQVVNARDENEAVAAIGDAEGFFGKMTPAILAGSGSLQWIQAPTASMEHYLFPELVDHDAVVTNMRGIYSDVITDQVMGYILCFARNLHLYVRRQVEHRWEAVGGESGRVGFATGPGAPTAVDLATVHLADATLGIVGLGGIGGEVARRASAFGMTVVAVDAAHDSLTEEDLSAACIETCWPPERLDDLLGAADFVCIAIPHTPQTERLFRRERFAKMKSTAYLINIGRGVIVDLADLTVALESGTIAGAALDVFEEEPLPADHPLWCMENVIITPHVAGVSRCVPQRHLGVLLGNIARFQQERPLQNVVDKRLWY